MFKKLLIRPGDRYGRLVVLDFAGNKPNGARAWLCRCDCGTDVAPTATCLVSGGTTSCGCFRAERVKVCSITHGRSKSREYHAWNDMRRRCSDPNRSDYKWYGGRGVTVCPEWNEFQPFFDHMGLCPDGFTLGRIENDQGYGPGNCRWESARDQANNRRSSRWITHDGKTHTLAQWTRITGLSTATLHSRLKKGWPVADALTVPPQKSRHWRAAAI